MNKKCYQSPWTKVVKVQQTEIICGNIQSNTQNEQYGEGSTDLNRELSGGFTRGHFKKSVE